MNTNPGTHLGENLIFIISQPRSGSTLLQRILAGNPAIYTIDEPWLMLKPLYGMNHQVAPDKYNTQIADQSLRNLLASLPKREEEYYEGVRRMYGYLYERALQSSGKQFFLDKTPPYFFIVPELIRTFPAAKYIFLLRNPMGVLGAIYANWIKQDWLALHNENYSLFWGPPALLNGITISGKQGLVIHYEEMVRSPEIEIRRMCEWLGVGYSPTMIEYGNLAVNKWKTGDQNLYAHTRPHTASAERWRSSLADPQFWRVANEYLNDLGSQTVESLGYSFQELRQAVDNSRPNSSSLFFTFSLKWLLAKPREQRHSWERWGVRTLTSLRHRGPFGTLTLGASRAWSSFSVPTAAERNPTL